ncbi:M15 family metallopeptidase [Avibacterium paragallinarum]|uniref:M15 family metallopeptidase n=1 Tax=Avibacterium paragallinarum TaxID=728 RepID=A0ABU7QJB4_AVIPA|nr:M15 family metallopeptidase [Avibacterium paragallinarum]
MFKFSQRSEKHLQGVHGDLVKVVRKALEYSTVDFAVIEGVRTKARQAQLFKQGATKTMNSRHLTGHAVDLAPLVEGKIPWSERDKFKEIAKAMFRAAKELNVTIRWGGDWNGNGKSEDERFYDGPHFELHRAVYS